MMRSNRASVAAAVAESHARALHAGARKMARAWRVQACDLRAAAAPDGRFDRIVARRLHNVAQRCGRI
eukprot:5770878-Lingulodinium_polyedra.AAC.1